MMEPTNSSVSGRLTPQSRPQDRSARVSRTHSAGLHSRAMRVAMVFSVMFAGFAGVGAQLVRLGLSEQAIPRASISRPLAETFTRPDIVDRNGIILATDVAMQSLYADPSLLLGVDETLEKLTTVLPGIDTPSLRRMLSNRQRRFVWVRRGLSPNTAQRVFELGLPGIDFRPEPKRGYPQGRVAGHVIGNVNIDNKGTSGIEQYIDGNVGVDRVVGDQQASGRQLRLTLDLPAQAALEFELAAAMERYSSVAASAVIMDVVTGAVRAGASLPTADPANPAQAQHLRYLDRLKRGTYELGSIFKAVSIAMALEKRTITTKTKFDVSHPIEIGRFRIVDHVNLGRPLTVEEIFIHSSNVGVGRIALEIGRRSQKAFLSKLGLLSAMQTDAGSTAEPQVPANWQKAEVVTIAYGHGLAVAPLQFAAAGATLVNGGFEVKPHFVESNSKHRNRRRILSARTSDSIRRLMRLNVTSPQGTGAAADVPGYEVGGKTGTADRAAAGRYDGNAVVTSFFAAFPMSKPRYVALITLHEPKGIGRRKKRSASLNAAPTTARIIERIAPLLGVLPK
jgi:cell division protein FtsI (penicillin-binding protein 3)